MIRAKRIFPSASRASRLISSVGSEIGVFAQHFNRAFNVFGIDTSTFYSRDGAWNTYYQLGFAELRLIRKQEKSSSVFGGVSMSKIKEGCVEVRDCWRCRKAVDCLKEKYFCPTCSAIQPAEGQNFFEYLGVDPAFDVNISTVKRNFLKLQTKIHPDKFSKCSSEEKHISELCSSYLNEAYRTLTEPLRRAQYLLKLKGQNTSDESTATSSAFLIEMMELNEEVDVLEEEATIRNMLEAMEERIDELCQSFKKKFESRDYQAAKQAVLKMGFYYRVRANLNKKLHALAT